MPCGGADEMSRENRINDLEAALCAIISELGAVTTFDINYFLEQASLKSGMDIIKFWKEHKEKDRDRLKEKFKKTFSAHEAVIIKQMLNEEL